MAFEPSGSVSSAQACSAIALRSTTRRRAAHEQLEDQVLGRGQVELAARPPRPPASTGSRASAAALEDGPSTPRGPALEGADAGQQLAEVERLDEVVVGAGVEAADPVGRRVARGEHEERGRARVAPGPGDDVDALRAGHPPVDDRDVVLVPA